MVWWRCVALWRVLGPGPGFMTRPPWNVPELATSDTLELIRTHIIHWVKQHTPIGCINQTSLAKACLNENEAMAILPGNE